MGWLALGCQCPQWSIYWTTWRCNESSRVTRDADLIDYTSALAGMFSSFRFVVDAKWKMVHDYLILNIYIRWSAIFNLFLSSKEVDSSYTNEKWNKSWMITSGAVTSLVSVFCCFFGMKDVLCCNFFYILGAILVIVAFEWKYHEPEKSSELAKRQVSDAYYLCTSLLKSVGAG